MPAQSFLIVVNDAPYHGERAYNALRLATSLSADRDTTVKLFLIGDGALCAVSAQTPPPDCQFNIEWLIQRLTPANVEIAVCRTCMDARGITESHLISGTRRGSLDDLSTWTRTLDRTLVF